MNNKITHQIKFSPEFNQMVYTARNLQFFRRRFGIDDLNEFVWFSIIHTIKNLRPEIIEFYEKDLPLDIEEVKEFDQREFYFVERCPHPNQYNKQFETAHDTYHYMEDRKSGKIKYSECSDVEKDMINNIFKS